MMTRKHFESIAFAVFDVRERYSRDSAAAHLTDSQLNAAYAALNLVSEELSRACSLHNPKFDKATFLKACGVEVSS